MPRDIVAELRKKNTLPTSGGASTALPAVQPQVEGPVDILADKGVERPNLLTDPVRTLKRSGGDFVDSMVQAVKNPKETVTAIGNVAAGGVQKLIPGEQGQEQVFDGLVDFYASRYGSVDSARQTALEDPIGFLSDASLFLTGAGGAVAASGRVANVSRVAQMGQRIAKAGAVMDPLAIASKAAGGGVAAVTKGRRIGARLKDVDHAAVKAASDLGIDLPASAKTNAGFVPNLEATVAKGPFGSKVADRAMRASQKLAEKADDLVVQTHTTADLGEAGRVMVEGVDEFRKQWFDAKRELYDAADFGTRGREILFQPKSNKALQTAEKFLQQKSKAQRVIGQAKSRALFNRITKALRGRKITTKGKLVDEAGQPLLQRTETRLLDATEVKAALDEINELVFTSTDPVITGNKAQLKLLATQLADELDEVVKAQNPQLFKQITDANDLFKDGLKQLNSEFGKRIVRLQDQPDKIVPALFSPSSSTDDIQRIYKVIGPERTSQVQAAFLGEMIRKSKNAEGLLTPQGLSSQIKRFSDRRLGAILTPEQLQSVQRLDTVARSLGRSSKVIGGSQTSFNQRLIAMAAAGAFDPKLAAQLMLVDAGTAAAVNSNVGQRFLSTGVDLSRPGARVGRRIRRAGEQAGPIGGSLRVIGELQEQ